MKCLYEELGVACDATDSDIQTAYRKLAWRWQPDPNRQASEDGKDRLQLIQQAYDVLSVPQDRAWYDNHRDKILDCSCLIGIEYFTSFYFRGYGDDRKGFYAVYRQVFEKIAAEDAEFMDDEDEVEQIPTFGDSKSSYEDVVAPFYAYWQAYCTKQTYAWLCPYDVEEIRDRRILREVEKEAKKVAQKARKERNEEVRNFVSFVRKRDKRVQAYRKVLQERVELKRKKQEQNRLERIRKRQRELEEMRQNYGRNNHHHDDYEAQLKRLDDFYVNEIYSIACNKILDRAYANCESSKNHHGSVASIKFEMQAKMEAFEERPEKVEVTASENDYASADEEIPAVRKAKKDKKTRKNAKFNKSQVPDSDDKHIESIVADMLAGVKIADSDEENWNSCAKKRRTKTKAKQEIKNSAFPLMAQ